MLIHILKEYFLIIDIGIVKKNLDHIGSAINPPTLGKHTIGFWKFREKCMSEIVIKIVIKIKILLFILIYYRYYRLIITN